MNQKIKPKKGYKFEKWLFGKTIEIPEEWEKTEQRNVCEFINGYAFSESEFTTQGYLVIRIQNLTGGKNFMYSNIKLPEKQFAVKGDLLFTWSATFSPFIWNGEKSAFHYHQWKIIPKQRNDKMFLYYHLEQIASIIKHMGQSGLGMFHITKAGMEQFPILKPKELQEQQKIASILSKVDALIESTDKTIESAENLKKGLMQKLLIKGIGHKKFKKVKWLFGKTIEIPEEWNIQKIKDIGKIDPETIDEKKYGFVNIKYIDIGSIENFKIKETKTFFFEERPSRAQKILKKYDVIISTVRPYLKAFCIINDDYDNLVCSTGFTVIRSVNKTDSEWIYYFSQTHHFIKYLMRLMHGSNYPAVSSSMIGNMLISYTINHKEQQKIISILSNVDSQITTQSQYKEKLGRLKKSLMQKLLTGEIRVKV